MDLKALGRRIRRQREKRGLRQADISGALQMSAQAVSKWERGENAPDVAVLAPLARLLDVSIEFLLEGDAPDRDTFRATVFFTTLNGFAARAATMPPRDLALWVNQMFYAVTETVTGHDGVPVKVVGDGFLGFFAGRLQEARALAAGRDALAALAEWDLVVALHTGDIYLGALGHPDHARPDILGGTVNTAYFAMQWAAQKHRRGLVLTDETMAALQTEAGGLERAATSLPGAGEFVDLWMAPA